MESHPKSVYCTHCGAKNPTAARFCAGCGIVIETADTVRLDADPAPDGPPPAPEPIIPAPEPWRVGRRRMLLPFPLMGGAAVAASALWPWFTTASGDAGADELPARIVVDFGAAESDFTLAIALVVLGAAIVVTSLVPVLRLVRHGLGAAAVVGGLLYVNEVREFRDRFDAVDSLTDLVGTGVWIAVAGGLLALVSPALHTRKVTL